MSRIYTRNSRGRQPLLATAPRFAKTKEHLNDTYQQPAERKRRLNSKYAVTVKQAKRRRVAASAASATSSSESDINGDASDEESEADEEEPAVIAPSPKRMKIETGLTKNTYLADDGSFSDESASMFGDFDDCYDDGEDPTLSPEENRRLFEKKVFAESDDDDNDDVYQAVDDISDSEDEAGVADLEEQEIIASLSSDNDDDNDDDGEHLYLNQIDGLSAYGFGDDSDGSVHFAPSSRGSFSAPDAGPQRHVRFDIETTAIHRMGLSQSPTIARALLPSALADPSGVFGGPAAVTNDREQGPPVDDEYDSDVTDDCLPEEARTNIPTVLKQEADEEVSILRSVSPQPTKPKKLGTRRGPPRGIFIDDGEKASGILDASGKIMLITHPHLLGEEFAKRYGGSDSSSPDVGFEELMDESEAGDSQAQFNSPTGLPEADIMIAGLNSSKSDSAYLGQATGPQEAFFPADGLEAVDYGINPDDLEGDFDPDADLGEDVINIHDVLKFEDDSDDSDSPTSPIYVPPGRQMTGLGNVNNEFSHLTNENVTAFRRNADPTYAAFSNRPAFPDFSTLSTPTTRRKRKANESPYTSSHYKGVTPVQRMRDPTSSLPPQTPQSAGPSAKRQKLMT